MDSFLRISSASKFYRMPGGGEVKALDGVSIDIKNNEFLTLLGPSGCGKTTLLKCIAGFEDLDVGDIVFEGVSLRQVPAHRRPFNTVFQNYALFPHMDVSDNVGYGLDVAGTDKKERNARVNEMLDLVGLSGFGGREPRQLSGGQQQRVALARSLVLKPRVLLLDEPLSALDRKMRETMQVELKNLQHSVGITFVFVTHDQDEALAMSDRIAVVSQGKVQQLAGPKEIYDAPANEFVANFVGRSNIFTGKIIKADGGYLTLRTGNGRELLAKSDRFTSGDHVSMVLRPEHLTLSPLSGADEDIFVPGTVTNCLFVGSDMQLHVDVGLGRTALVRHRHNKGATGEDFHTGAEVKLYYSPEAAHLIESTGG
ncbi:ABC transporter ATP-binding protein [Hoeflea ulvae]|uniref:Spermidine/putrescine import ATP-binding protein PotA n=1 Tax=Hoeflea ulvae TaxID=2983764 RepID=A0ABT3YMA2_9HYPH|nr:ABC transporter ATP-binding protein [Hoeflea ulvae]MCY0097039.1 ABC transporter ATP-binding protein [Hoeflea ulvae]